MKILIIGGSRFVGPIVVEKLAGRGHSITVFNRGLMHQEYAEGIRFIKGDRKDGFPFSEYFDVVIDTCAYEGTDTERVVKGLKFDFLVHFSTAAVYEKPETFPLTEESKIGDWPVWKDYNRGKVECEEVLQNSGIAYASLRPVYILGPRNYLNRELFIYSRLKKRLPIVLPGNGEAVIQFVFIEDVAEAMVLLTEKRLAGAFNCAGDEMVTLKRLVKEMGNIVGEKPVIEYNLAADGEIFNSAEFPFANENMILNNRKLKGLGIEFTPLFSGLRRDYENYYRYEI